MEETSSVCFSSGLVVFDLISSVDLEATQQTLLSITNYSIALQTHLLMVVASMNPQRGLVLLSFPTTASGYCKIKVDRVLSTN